MHTMTKREVKSGTIDVKALLVGDEEFLRVLVRMALQEVLEVEPQQTRRSAFHVRRDKAALFKWVQAPPGDRSSRKRPE